LCSLTYGHVEPKSFCFKTHFLLYIQHSGAPLMGLAHACCPDCDCQQPHPHSRSSLVLPVLLQQWECLSELPLISQQSLAMVGGYRAQCKSPHEALGLKRWADISSQRVYSNRYYRRIHIFDGNRSDSVVKGSDSPPNPCPDCFTGAAQYRIFSEPITWSLQTMTRHPR